MTAATITPSRHRSPGAAGRILNVVRLHLVNVRQIFVVPWLIMAFIFALSVAIGWIVRASLSPADLADANSGMQYSGAIGYFLVYMLVIAVMAINQTFPFAQSYSVTRRDFYLGTLVAFAGLSVVYSIAVTVLGWLEDVTNGWGFGVTLFSPEYLGPNLLQRFYVSLVLFLFFFVIGMAVASVYLRWKVNGMLIFFATLVLLIVGFIALIAATASWSAVGQWFVMTGFVGVISWTLVPTSVAAIFGYLLLRWATPRN